MADQQPWEPMRLSLVRDGYLAIVEKKDDHRWRWVASPLEHLVRSNRSAVEGAWSKGFCGSREKAMKTAEAAIEALKVAARGDKS